MMKSILAIKIKNLSWGQHWSILTFDVSTIQKFYRNEISSMDFPQHGEVFYFYGQALIKCILSKGYRGRGENIADVIVILSDCRQFQVLILLSLCDIRSGKSVSVLSVRSRKRSNVGQSSDG
jgi:hypothetical protein